MKVFSPETRARISAAMMGNKNGQSAWTGKKPWNRASGIRNLIELAVPARMKSEKQGPFESNIFAEIWRLRSPINTVHEFRNLKFWLRENGELFDPEDVIWKRSAGGLWCRASVGLARLSPRGKNPKGSWKGWTWHSQTERLKNECRDLLERAALDRIGG